LCQQCEKNILINDFPSWISGNEKIDNLIKKMQLGINKYKDIIVEWIPYNQFNNIKELLDKDELQHVRQYGRMVRYNTILLNMNIQDKRIIKSI
jgi:hypothetical protein